MSYHKEDWIALGTTVKTFVQTHPAVWYAAGLVVAFCTGYALG